MFTNHIAPRFEPAVGYFKTETTMNKNLTSAIIIGFFVDLAFCFAPKIFCRAAAALNSCRRGVVL